MSFSRLSLPACAALLLALSVGGQELGLLVSAANSGYMTGEPIVTALRVHNRTTRTFSPRRGNEHAQLTIMVTRGEDADGVDSHHSEVHVADIDLAPGNIWQGNIEVSKFFPMRQQGRYLVRLVGVHDGLRYQSFPRAFDVVAGFEITKVQQVFPGEPPLQRELRLCYWGRNQMEELFLQIEERPESRQWRTYSLGPLVRTTAPKIDIAPDGLLTIVHRATPDVFLKSQVRSDETEVVYLGQERLIDPVASSSKRMAPFQAMAMEDAIKKRDEESQKKRSWWPF